MNKKSQSSFEFILIFVIGFVLVVVVSGIFFIYSNDSVDSLNQAQIEKFGNELMENINTMFFLTDGNKVSYDFMLPDGIENFSVIHLNKTVNGKKLQVDYLNITYINNGEIVSTLFFSNEPYIRFNLSKTGFTKKINYGGGNSTIYINDSFIYGSGSKTIEIYSRGSYVEFNFKE